MNDVETRSIEQLPPATAVSPNALTAVQEPGGPVQKLKIRQLLGRLISTDEVTEEETDLQALLDYPANSVGLVFADPTPAKNGWYRKRGAPGAGDWLQFEKLSADAAAEVQALVDQAEAAQSAAETAKDSAVAAAAFNIPWLGILADPENEGQFLIPLVDCQPQLGRLWLDGSSRDFSEDMTDHGDGSYTFEAELGDLSAGTLLYVEWSDLGTGTPTGCFVAAATEPSGALTGSMAIRAAYSETGIASPGALFNNRATNPDAAITTQRWGQRRAIMATAPGVPLRTALDDTEVSEGANVTEYLAPEVLTIGRRTDGALVLAHAQIERVVVYAGSFSVAQIEAIMAALDPVPVPAEQSWPDWLPVIAADDGTMLAPVAFADEQRNRFWQKGRVCSEAEFFSAGPNGIRVMRKPPHGLRPGSGVSVLTDIQNLRYFDTVDFPSGHVFQAIDSTQFGLVAERLQMQISLGNVSGGGAVSPGGLAAPVAFASQVGDSFGVLGLNGPAGSPPEQQTKRGQGIERFGISMPGNQNDLVITGKCAWPVAVGADSGTRDANYDYIAQDYWVVGGFRDGSNLLDNCTIERFVVYNRSLSESELQRAMNWNIYGLPGLLFNGDSYNNFCMPMEATAIHLADAGYEYIPMMSCGLGGRGLSFHKELLELYLDQYDYLRDFLLVMSEGGFDFSSIGLDNVTRTPAAGDYSRRQVVNLLIDTFRMFREPRKVYCESQTNYISGEQLTQTRQYMADIKATFPRFFCETMAMLKAQAASDGDYVAQMAGSLTPESTRYDEVHITWGTQWGPSANGYWAWGLSIVMQLASLGYLPSRQR